MGRPTIRDVALEACVSLGTVSRVVNGHSAVKDELRKRVEAAIERLGYRPNAVAQSMRLGSTRTIGLLIRDFSSPAFVSFANVAQDTLFAAGYTTLLASYDDRPEREIEVLHAFAQRRIDGLIVTSSSDTNEQVAKARAALDVPTILFDRDSDRDKDVIAIDHASGMRDAVRYLIELGHQDIALLTGPVSVRPGRERVKGYKKAFSDAKLKIEPEFIQAGGFASEFAYSRILELIRLSRRPTALIVGGVNMLSGALRAIRASGLRIPQDISLIGSTNPELCELLSPTITELRVDYPAIGRQASELLLGRLQGSVLGPPRVLRFGTTLLERESCAPPPVQRKRVRVTEILTGTPAGAAVTYQEKKGRKTRIDKASG